MDKNGRFIVLLLIDFGLIDAKYVRLIPTNKPSQIVLVQDTSYSIHIPHCEFQLIACFASSEYTLIWIVLLGRLYSNFFLKLFAAIS